MSRVTRNLVIAGLAVVAIALMLLLSGCNNPPTPDIGLRGDDEIVVIDSCQYIKTRVYMGHAYVHKGNCSNPIHKN